IIPLRLSTETLPEDLEYFLSLTQWLDAPEGATEQNLRRLTGAVADALAGKPAASPAPLKRRSNWVAGLISALAMGAGAVVYWRAETSRPEAPPASAAAITTS